MTYRRVAVLVVGLILTLGCALLGGREVAPPEAAVEPTSVVEAAATPTARPADEDEPAATTGDLVRSETGGFACREIPGFMVEATDESVVMIAPSAGEDGPALLMMGGEFWEGMTVEELLEIFADDEDLSTGEARSVMVAGAPGLDAEQSGDGVRGRLMALMPSATQGFILMARAPEGRWAEFEPLLSGVIESLSFFAPVAGSVGSGVAEMPAGLDAPAELNAPVGWRVFSDANEVRGLVYHDGTVYAAGLGGMVAWDVAAGTGVKSTTLDGLGQISVRDAVYCEVPLTPGGPLREAVVVGTGEGLSAYDVEDARWVKLDPGLEGFPLSSRVSRLFCDSAHQRLLMSNDGLGIWDFGEGSWQRITTRDGMLWNEARGIAVRGDEIWVGSGYNGISVITDGVVTATYDEEGGLPSNRVHALVVDRDGQTLWMGTGKGLVRFSGGQWTLYGPDEVEGMPRGSLYYVIQAADGSLWVGSETGTVCRLDPATKICTDVYRAETRNPYVAALTLDDEGALYFSDGRWAVHTQAAGGWQTLVYPGEVVASNFVDAIAEDADGMLWIGTNGGLQRLDPADPDGAWETFDPEDGTGGGRARSIAPAPDGTLWFAMVNGDATRFGGDAWSTREGLRSANVVAADAQGRGWFGTNDGIVIWDGDGSTVLGEADGLPNARVLALVADGETMWIGTGAGVARWEAGTIEVVLTKESPALGGGYVQSLALMGDGSLLVGTMGALARYDGAGATRLEGAGGGVRSIAVSREGRIWIACTAGLSFSDDGGATWTTWTAADGLPTTFVNAVYADRYGSLWISGGGDGAGGGLARYVP